MKILNYLILLMFIFNSGCTIKTSGRALGEKSEFIFSEKYRDQWKGLHGNWRWNNSVLIGETTEVDPIEQSSFLIWNREVQDFILNIKFRISEHGNSGIYYRSEWGPEGYDELLGYQADIDGANNYTGIVYENFMDRHRKILAKRGQFARISKTDSLQLFPITFVEHSSKDLINDNMWNEYELIVCGPLIVQKLNGIVMSIVEDLAENRVKKGLFGFQLHQGPSMKVEFKNAVFVDLSN